MPLHVFTGSQAFVRQTDYNMSFYQILQVIFTAEAIRPESVTGVSNQSPTWLVLSLSLRKLKHPGVQCKRKGPLCIAP